MITKMTTDNRSESKKDVTYGTATVYTESVRNASLESMAKLVRIFEMLLRTKVYLFRSQRWSSRLFSIRKIRSERNKYAKNTDILQEYHSQGSAR